MELAETVAKLLVTNNPGKKKEKEGPKAEREGRVVQETVFPGSTRGGLQEQRACTAHWLAS